MAAAALQLLQTDQYLSGGIGDRRVCGERQGLKLCTIWAGFYNMASFVSNKKLSV